MDILELGRCEGGGYVGAVSSVQVCMYWSWLLIVHCCG